MPTMDEPRDYDAVSAVAFLVGFYEGVLPFVAKVLGWTPFLSVPSRMDAPAWWLVSAAVLVVAVVVLDRTDRAKRRRFGPEA
jgi:hypothetical protein